MIYMLLLLFSLAITLNCTSLYPRYAKKTIHFVASRLPKRQEMRKQEWLAILDEIPGNFCKLVYSLSLLPVIFTIRRKNVANKSK